MVYARCDGGQTRSYPMPALPLSHRCATLVLTTGSGKPRLDRQREDAHDQDACATAVPRALRAHIAVRRRSENILLDLARVPGRSGLDLFPCRSELVGEGHRPDGQDLVP